MSRSNDTLEDDLGRMFHRREADVAPPLHLPPSLRRNVRARQAGRFLAITAAVALVTAGSLAVNRLVGSSSSGTPADNRPAPSYVPPIGVATSPAPYTVAAKGEAGGVRFALLASGDPAEGHVSTRLTLSQAGLSRGMAPVVAQLRHLESPLRAIYEVALVDLARRMHPFAAGCSGGSGRRASDDHRLAGRVPAADPHLGRRGRRRPIRRADARLAPRHDVRGPDPLHATTIFGGDLGTRPSVRCSGRCE